MRYLIPIFGCLLTSCALYHTEPVFLKHPTSGKTVQCGPYKMVSMDNTDVALRELQCIQDFKDQGYQRVAK